MHRSQDRECRSARQPEQHQQLQLQLQQLAAAAAAGALLDAGSGSSETSCVTRWQGMWQGSSGTPLLVAGPPRRRQ